MQLIMKTPQRSFGRVRVVVLNETVCDAEVGEIRFMVSLEKEATGVAMENGPQLKYARKGCLAIFVVFFVIRKVVAVANAGEPISIVLIPVNRSDETIFQGNGGAPAQFGFHFLAIQSIT